MCVCHYAGDFLLGVLRGLIERRADLKLVFMSATINIQLYSGYFNDAPVIRVSVCVCVCVCVYWYVCACKSLNHQSWFGVDILIIAGSREVVSYRTGVLSHLQLPPYSTSAYTHHLDQHTLYWYVQVLTSWCVLPRYCRSSPRGRRD